MARQAFYDRKSGFNVGKTVHNTKKQIPNAEQELTQKSNEKLSKYALIGIIAYFLCC